MFFFVVLLSSYHLEVRVVWIVLSWVSIATAARGGTSQLSFGAFLFVVPPLQCLFIGRY
jgi:hypothetical protein